MINNYIKSSQYCKIISAASCNRAISLIRKENAKGNYLNETFNSSMLTRDVMTDYIEVETRTRLFNAIATLPPELRQIFNLSFEEGLRNPEIAARLGVAEITIKKRKARLITRLRDIFGISPDLLLAIDIIYYSNLFKPT
ncbi:RNA polymerase sigma factor [Lepagella muris]|uniref:RNA polymerase sigma factor n=1 Tax=Lepagella muris TaxID=3032870 RepID=A0AC61RN11_9BACT|nr:RNA polymerase sigma factor [Lepagella muris]ROT08871.1 RNA polymerase sigma factor [Muribaculaceae bacterium Isolate-037 (Harlan)]TGY80056.1 RNA polymerase sigma factor [Lepagella muris]THG53294.1 RNA polymerase sigma factor [Bacteroidales bacterium]TKC64820.1 RNA polymerase sigma factor [Bacteroidales bacterium]